MSARLANLSLILALALPPAFAGDDAMPDMARAEAWLRAGQSEAAWKLLEPFEFEFAGNQNFDYLLGLAALETGQPSRASFIFERVIGINPDHAAARLDFARALYAAGDYERARQEFEAVRQYAPPAMAEQTIRQHLAAIDNRTSTGKPRVSGYVEGGLGRDSNVNAGVSGGQYFMPILDATLSSEARRAAHASVAAGAELALASSPEQEFFAGIDIRRRHHQARHIDSTMNADYYDTRSFDGRFGVQQKLDGANALRVTTALSRQTLDDGHAYRRTQTLMTEWRHDFTAQAQGTVWVLDQRNRYGSVGDTSFRQYGGNQLLAGVGMISSVAASLPLLLHFSAYAGKEAATDIGHGNLDGDKQLAGLRIGSQIRLFPELDLSAALGGALTRYALTNPLFFDKRRDQVWDASIGAQWRMSDAWSLRPHYIYSRSDSNIGAYDNARHDYSLTLRYDFR